MVFIGVPLNSRETQLAIAAPIKGASSDIIMIAALCDRLLELLSNSKSQAA
jgi:hypothetical protein